MAEPTSHFVTAGDGLRLHYRSYGPVSFDAPTVVCLPGLARTAMDFERLAERLAAAGDGRRVLALDYRGRGRSDRDPNPDNYDLMIEADDVVTVLTAAGVSQAVFIGTSRGGLLTMILAALRPTLLRGAVLNDIGPVIEARGLARIRGYVGKLPQPRSWTDAVDLFKQLAGAQFTALSEDDWMLFARSTFEEIKGTFVPRYDPALMNGLAKLDLENIPKLWPQFEGLRAIPVLALRGENSDLLSAETLREMATRHPAFAGLTIPGQGHAPLLTDDLSITRILDFVRECESQVATEQRTQNGLRLLY